MFWMKMSQIDTEIAKILKILKILFFSEFFPRT